MKNITHYLRSCLLSQLNNKIDFKNENNFEKVSSDEINCGRINLTATKKLYKLVPKNPNTKPPELIDIIISLKTISTNIVDSRNEVNKVGELSSLFYVPASLKPDGQLTIPTNKDKLPWIPREYLTPMIDEELSIGKADDYDAFLEENLYLKYKISSFEDYHEYSLNLFNFVTNHKTFNSQPNEITDYTFDENIYIFLDTTVNTTFHIEKLYTNLLSEEPHVPLYQKLVKIEAEPPKALIPNNNILKLKEHCGQMNGEYPLSSSQRESLNHFNELNDGDILAINGPPGTGKTTLLQSIVADLFTRNAIEKKPAPIIVAASTNNQAVTNIIESFGKINKLGIGNLEERWLTNLNSFASYFPSSAKIPECIKNNYQYVDYEKCFINLMDNKDNLDSSKHKMITQCNIYFKKSLIDIQQCQILLHNQLLKIEKSKNYLIANLYELKKIISDNTISEYDILINREIASTNADLKLVESQLNELKIKRNFFVFRIEEWEKTYQNIPLFIRLFSFMPFAKRKILNFLSINRSTDEASLLIGDLSLDQIQEKYRNLISLNDIKYNKLSDNQQIIQDELDILQKKESEFDGQLENFYNLLDDLITLNIDILGKNDFTKNDNLNNKFLNSSIDDFNTMIDTNIRYVTFWLATHYYECTWLLDDTMPTLDQKQFNHKDTTLKIYKRLAMLTPCMVMTFYMLPKHFKIFRTNEQKQSYLYNFIDLLIVDEAGQITPEIAAPSFSLAKKSVVVGDQYQIPPIWNVSAALDKSLAIENNVISDFKGYSDLILSGLNTSSSSIMKVASNSTSYNKLPLRGLCLTEHRRCYNEIIEYCNELIYNKKLEPLRGSFISDINNPIKDFLPPMGFKNINVSKSHLQSGSRYNDNEAQEIVNWLNANYALIVEKYKLADSTINEKNILSIIAPFTQQVKTIRYHLKKSNNPAFNNIQVGTIHTFQGSEKNIIILSTTYGNEESCFFIDKNKSLMNVAVSRAKDSFLLFGARDCLSDNVYSASGLLKKYCRYPIN